MRKPSPPEPQTPGKHRRPFQKPNSLPSSQSASLTPSPTSNFFPYVNQLLADLRIAEPERVGFYSGLVVRMNCLDYCFCYDAPMIGERVLARANVFDVSAGEDIRSVDGHSHHIGQRWAVEDVVGRCPVVFTSLVGIAMSTTAFGLSTSFAGIIASRCLGGFVAANETVIHSILAETTDDTNQDLAVSIYSLSWPVGSVIGPLIGGTLANAATRCPQYFSWRVFVEHPYLPPCIVSAACALVEAGLGCTLIEETLPSKRKDARAGTNASSSLGSRTETDSNGAEPASVMELLSIPTIRALTISGFALSFLSLAFDVVFALFCYTPVGAGGLGLEPSTIGNVLASAGTLAVLLRFFAMPYILRRFDYAKTYNVCMYIWPVVFGLLPFLNVLARTHPPTSSNTASSALVWTGLLTLFAVSKIGAIPHSLSMLLIKRYAPSQSSLGRSNGLVQFSKCVGRALGPIVASTLFTGVNGMEWVRE